MTEKQTLKLYMQHETTVGEFLDFLRGYSDETPIQDVIRDWIISVRKRTEQETGVPERQR